MHAPLGGSRVCTECTSWRGRRCAVVCTLVYIPVSDVLLQSFSIIVLFMILVNVLCYLKWVGE